MTSLVAAASAGEFDERRQHLQPVPGRRAGLGVHETLNFLQRGSVISLGFDWANLHRQPHTGVAVTGGGLRQNFTVRRVTHGVGVERTFMIHSPRIDKIDVLRHGDVRQGRLYYLRGKVGKEARIRERRRLIQDEEPDEKPAEATPEAEQPVETKA